MNPTQAIIEALNTLGGTRSIQEIRVWVEKKYHGNTWQDFGTSMADMVPVSDGGNNSSTVPDEFRVLKRVSRGKYRKVLGESIPTID